MSSAHVLSRRLFLTELGRNSLAVAVLGAGLAACSAGDEVSGGPRPSVESQGGGGDGADTPAEAADGEAGGGPEASGPLRWERVELGFVSAYILVRGREVAIVDTGTPGSGPSIASGLTDLGLGWPDVDHVIVTHAHGDHVGGLDEVLTAASDAVGYAGVGDIEGLSAPRDLVAVSGGEEVFGLQIVATPGHTKGHISAFDPETGLLIAGDAMVSDDAGRLAGPAAEFTDDLPTAHQSVVGLSATDIDTILVGHGAPVVDDAAGQLASLAVELG